MTFAVLQPVTAHTTPLLLGAMRDTPRTPTAWAWITAFALVDGVAFQGFLAEGLQRTSAGLGSVIIDSQPLSVALMAALFFGEALSGLGVLGLLIGVAGLVLLEVPPEALGDQLGALLGAAGSSSSSSTELAVGASTAAVAAASGIGQSFLGSGEFYMLLAAQSMAVGTVMVR
jgi:drug/metabolite transporter (DMT)-like permease